MIDCMNDIIKEKNIDKSHADFNEEISKYARITSYFFNTIMYGKGIDKLKKTLTVSNTQEKENIADIFYAANGFTKEKREMLINELSGVNNFDFYITRKLKKLNLA